MHFKMSSAICFNLDQSKILLSGNGLKPNSQILTLTKVKAFAVYQFKDAFFDIHVVQNILGKEENAGYQHFLVSL